MGLIWQLQFLVLFLTFFIPLPVGMSFCFKNFAGFSIGVNNLRVWLSSREKRCRRPDGAEEGLTMITAAGNEVFAR